MERVTDGETDRHRLIAYTVLAWHCAVETIL